MFPELGLTSYTSRDLFFDRTQLDACINALNSLLQVTKDYTPLVFIGMPLETPQVFVKIHWQINIKGLYNVAVAIQSGKILGVVPKSYLPSYRFFISTSYSNSFIENLRKGDGLDQEQKLFQTPQSIFLAMKFHLVPTFSLWEILYVVLLSQLKFARIFGYKFEIITLQMLTYLRFLLVCEW